MFTKNLEALGSYSPEELAEINPTDAQHLGVKEGKRVKVALRRGELETKIRITERVTPEDDLPLYEDPGQCLNQWSCG